MLTLSKGQTVRVFSAFGSDMAARPPFRGVGVNVFDAGLLTALLQKNRARCFHTTFAHGKRKVIEIKRDVLRTRRGRLFNRKIDALVTFSMTASRHSEQCRAHLSAPHPDPAEVYEKERREMRQERVRTTGNECKKRAGSTGASASRRLPQWADREMDGCRQDQENGASDRER